MGYNGTALQSLNWVRIKLQMVFLSNITTTNGRQIDRQYPVDISASLDNSTYDFSREEPTPSEWTAWIMLWTRFTHPGLYLIDLLGTWVAPTHHMWDWFYDVIQGVVEHSTGDGVDYYHLLENRTRTCGEQIYVKVCTAPGGKTSGSPASVSFLDGTFIRFLGIGPPLASGPS